MDHKIMFRLGDKSVWVVSHRKMAEIIADKIEKAGKLKVGETKEMVIDELLEESDPIMIGYDQLEEWLDWSDVAAHALQLKQADPPYEQWWKDIDHWRDFFVVDKNHRQNLADLGWDLLLDDNGDFQIIKKQPEKISEGERNIWKIARYEEAISLLNTNLSEIKGCREKCMTAIQNKRLSDAVTWLDFLYKEMWEAIRIVESLSVVKNLPLETPSSDLKDSNSGQ